MKRYILHITALLLMMSSADYAWCVVNHNGGTMKGTFTLSDNTKLSNSIKVANGTTLTIDLNGYVLSGNGKEYVIIVEGGAKCVIKDSQPTIGHACSINNEGILMWPKVDGQTQVTVKGGIIYNPYTNQITDRKGISLSGECEIQSGKIMGCFSRALGAAVTATSSGKFTMNGGEIAYNCSLGTTYKSGNTDVNTSLRAGAVYGNEPNNNNGSSINISNTKIYNNYSGGKGGAICGWNVSLNNCEVYSNKSVKEGGAVYLIPYNQDSKKSTLAIQSNTNMHNNVSEGNGGAIYVENANLRISESQINNNDAGGNGGAIYAENTIMTMSGSSVNLNESLGTNTSGGGIYIKSTDKSNTCTINNSKINSNYAPVYGGGIYSNIPTTITESSICYNRAMSSQTAESKPGYGRGGGFLFSTEIECKLNNTQVDYNAAMWYGGGGQIDHGAQLTLSGNSTINNNTAILHGAGGLHLTSNAHLYFNGGSISKNEASTVGGAIHTSYGCVLELNGGTISENIAHQRGAGVHVNTGGDLILNGTDIISNNVYRGYDMVYCTVVRNSDGTYTWEQPIYATTESTYELDSDWKLKDSGYGGGVLIDSGTCTMNDGKLSGNYAEKAGGGLGLIMIRIPLEENNFNNMKVVQFKLKGGDILENNTDGDGAGVYLMRNKLSEMFAGLAQEQQDKLKGYENYNTLMTGKPSVSIYGGKLESNMAQQKGGAIMMEEGNFNISGEINLKNNQSVSDGGGIYIGGGAFILDESGNLIATGNSSTRGHGGAIYLGNGTFTSNSGSQLSLATNSANEGYGGGVYCGGLFTMNGTSQANLQSNCANSGGAIYATANVTITGNNTISKNVALANGGAIYVDGGNILFKGETEMKENSAGVNGGVAYVKNGSVTLEKGTTMSNNTAEEGHGGVFYVTKTTEYSGIVGVTTSTGTMSSNSALNGYGGVFFVDGGNITLGGKTTMNQNKAQNGGAIALQGGVFNIHAESSIINNLASANGGGLWVNNTTGNSIQCLGGSFDYNTAGGNGGGLYAAGNFDFHFAANLQDNQAVNGGGIYLDEGIRMNFGISPTDTQHTSIKDNGLIVRNIAKATENAQVRTTSDGTGGGIYLNQGTLTFLNTNSLGVYNNEASYEGADIYSSGTNTTLNLPNVSTMNLIGFEVAGSILYWVKDYHAMRYQTALKKMDVDIFNLIVPFDSGQVTQEITGLTSLDLGYDMVYVELNTGGLYVGDVVVVSMYYDKKKGTGPSREWTLYRQALLHGTVERTAFSRANSNSSIIKVGLPTGDWKFVASGYESEYEEEISYVGYDKDESTTEPLNEEGAVYEIEKPKTVRLHFIYTPKTDAKSTPQYIKVNKMKPKQSNTTL